MPKLIGRLIGFIVFLCLFAFTAAIVVSFSTGWAQQTFPGLGLPEPPKVDTSGMSPEAGSIAPHIPALSELPIDIPDTLKPGEEILLPERVQPRPLLAQVPAPQQLNRELHVAGGNIVLAIIMALLFGTTSAVLNNMLRDEEPRIRAWLQALGIKRLVEWAKKTFKWSAGRAVRQGCLSLPLIVVIFAIYGIVFAFLEKETPILSRDGIWLAVTMAFTVGMVSFAGDIARRIAGLLWRTESRFNVYPANIVIAGVTVVLSRILHLVPGIVYGTPGGAEVDFPSDKRERREIVLSLLTLGILVVFSCGGWLVSWWIVSLLGKPLDRRTIHLVATILTAAQNFGLALFLTALETAFFEMLPLVYSPGQIIFKWNKFVWGILFLPIAFIFNHALLNPRSGFLESFIAVPNVRFLWLVLFVLIGATGGLWFYFNALDDILREWLGIKTPSATHR